MLAKHFVLFCFLTLAFVAGAAMAQPATAPSGDPFFARERLWEFHLHLTADAWKRMQPSSRPRFLPRNNQTAADATTRPATRPAATDGPVISPMGYIYTAVKGTLQTPGEAPVEVAVRFKGNYSYSLTSRGLGRPMKIEFDKWDATRRFHGIRTLNLNAGALDDSLLREPLGYWIFREAGVPAPRTAYAKVKLTVDGLYDRKEMGTYVAVEQVDEEFLSAHFGNNDGMLLKPEMVRGLPYMGGRWDHYADRFNPKSQVAEASRRRFIEYVQLVHFADDAPFARKLGDYLDIDPFLKFIAVHALISNLDSFLTTGHNYWLYEDRRDGRYRPMPWDLNLAFGLFPTAGSPEMANLSVLRPYVPPNRLLERMLAIEPIRQQYDRTARTIATRVFTREKLWARIAFLAGTLGGPAAATRPSELRGVRDFEKFLTRRLDSVQAQFDGKNNGFVPAESPQKLFGNQWAEHRRISLVQSASMSLRQTGLAGASGDGAIAQLLAEAGRRFDVLCPAPGACNERDLIEALASVLPVPEHYIFDPGPAIDWSRILFKLADANNDGRLTRAEFVAALTVAANRADANKDGRLDAAELERALGRWVTESGR